MKHFTKLLILSFLFSSTAKAQTNVSGGIYANTTWTKANSPYIVTDTVVVFPNVTLTIEAGVTVNFADGKYLEMRQATLIAMGTATDSIMFTSNSASPHAGIWKGINLNHPISVQTEYCILKYASSALYGYTTGTNHFKYLSFYFNTHCIDYDASSIPLQYLSFYNNNLCISSPPYYCQNLYFYNNTTCIYSSPYSIKNSIFNNNGTCLYEGAQYIDNCVFNGNTNAGYVMSDPASVTNCIFLNNNVGLLISEIEGISPHSVINCIFCNNITGFIDQSVTHLTTGDSLVNCNFSNNHLGSWGGGQYMSGNIFTDNDTALNGVSSTFTNNYIYHNKVGILFLGGTPVTVSKNVICNSVYNLKSTSSYGGTFPNTCWCSTDSAAIRSKIYDGYENIALGLITIPSFVSCDSSAFSNLQPINCQTLILAGIEENYNQSKSSIDIYPNPFHTTATLHSPFRSGIFKVYNIVGTLLYSQSVSNQSTIINRNLLADGIYFYQLLNDNGEVATGKFIVN